MKRLVASCRRFAAARCPWSALALLAVSGLFSSAARAAPDLLVVEVSEADHAAAERLLELIGRPVQRARMPAAREAGPAFAALDEYGAERLVAIDTELGRVQVFRRRGATVLTRSVEAPANTDTDAAYVVAFVAFELLKLSTELERNAVEVESALAANSEGRETAERSPRKELGLVFRLGAELLGLGAPFTATLRPAAGAGVSFATAPASRLSISLLLEAAPFARAAVSNDGGRIQLTRSDLALRLGLGYALAPNLTLSGFVRPRAALTNAEYSGAGGTGAQRVRFGAGVGIEVALAVAPWLALFASPAIDFATSRSEYRAQGMPIARDPERLFVLAAGVMVIQRFR